jgi:hypothetical protein
VCGDREETIEIAVQINNARPTTWPELRIQISNSKKILAAQCARVVLGATLQKTEGAGNAGRSMHPRPRV